MFSNARCNAPSMPNALRNANHATQRYATNATTLRQPQKNLTFLSVRVGLWISQISPIKLMGAVELERPQTEKFNSRRGLTELRKEFS